MISKQQSGNTDLFIRGTYASILKKQQQQQQQQLIDFRGYPSLQLELELSWPVGAKVDQKRRKKADV